MPPFNGFASKWMIYQGIIETAKGGGYLWIVWLVAAMFGSALTLASFMKLIHSVFLGQPCSESGVAGKVLRDVSPSMWLPQTLLALLCVIFGVFAFAIPLKIFIFPSLGGEIGLTGVWSAGLATVLIVIGIIIGMLIYLFGKAAKTREVDNFIGGEILAKHPQMRLSGTEFYNTIQELGLIKGIYKLAHKKVFDIYEIGSKITFGFNKVLRFIHNGVLPTYMAWCLLGMVIIFYILLG